MRYIYLGASLILTGLIGFACSNPGSVEEVNESIELVAKEYDSKSKSFKGKTRSDYSCLVSFLADSSKSYNYWNKAYWIQVPESIKKQADGETIMKSFIYGDEHAGDKAGTYQDAPNVVIMAQCELPNSEKVLEKLDKTFKKLGSKIRDRDESSGKPKAKVGGDWECTQYFITRACFRDQQTGELYGCEITEIKCIRWYYNYESEEDPPTGGDTGFPSGDPGACDPGGIEPCMDDGGGSSPPPPNPDDPCESVDPPAWCEECTDDPLLENIQIRKGLDEMWESSGYGADSNPNPESERKEVVGFMIPKQSGDGYNLQVLKPNQYTFQDACNSGFPKFNNLPEGTIYVHTHPYKNNELQYSCKPGDVLKYKSGVGALDRGVLEDLGLQKGIILDASKVTIYEPNSIEKKITRCGY